MRTSFVLAAAAACLFVSSVASADEKPTASASALSDFRFGALVGAGAPSLVSGEILVQYKSVLAFGMDYGTTPSVHLPLAWGADVNAQSFSFTTRVRPFKGAFFLGLGLGGQQFSGAFTDPLHGPNVNASTSTIFVQPQIGFLHRFSSGLALGSDVAVELPIASRLTNDAMPSEVESAMRRFQKAPIPVLNLLRIGYVL